MWSSLQTILSLAALALSLALAGCGSSGSGTSLTDSAESKPVSADPPASGCGSYSLKPASDPDGVIASLPDSYADSYAGYTTTVKKSPWANFKPAHGPPYKVGLAFAQLSNDFQSVIFETLKKELGDDPDIEFTGVSTGSQLNIPQQQQQYAALLNDDPDILIVEPLTDAFGQLADKAGKKGIPTISFQGATTSDYSVNVQGNAYASLAQATSVAARRMNGKGNVMFVHGIASTVVDQDALAAYQSVLKNCPGIEEAGQIAGSFVSSTAKSETLKFLATHPQQIDAVVNVGGMAPGIISAFKEAGRPVPLVIDTAAQKGSLGFWDNTSGYQGFGQGFPPKSLAGSISDVTKRMLNGEGLKVTDITEDYPVISDDNLDKWAEPGWNLNTPGDAEGPPQTFLSDRYIGGLFANPSAGK